VDQVPDLDDDQIVGDDPGGGVGVELLEAATEHPHMAPDIADDGDPVRWFERRHP
jgi:hypothetical protein